MAEATAILDNNSSINLRPQNKCLYMSLRVHSCGTIVDLKIWI